MKILITEDEAVLSQILREKLERSEYIVEIARDGDAALEAAHTFKPDAILLDLMLPGKNGFEVLEILKGDATLKDIPVVVLSNLGEDSDIKRALSIGATDYFVKSEHSINEIIDKVKKVLVR